MELSVQFVYEVPFSSIVYSCVNKLRWVFLVVGDLIAIAGLSICDFVYRPAWAHGALGIGLILIGFQWVVTGVSVFNQK